MYPGQNWVYNNPFDLPKILVDIPPQYKKDLELDCDGFAVTYIVDIDSFLYKIHFYPFRLSERRSILTATKESFREFDFAVLTFPDPK